MNIIKLKEPEKFAIQQYLRSPRLHLNPEIAKEILSQDETLPEGTKVSRKSNNNSVKGRCYIIPSCEDIGARIIPITNLLKDDPIEHSATWLSGSIFFHQNKDDMPKILPDNFNDICESEDSDDDWSEGEYLQYRLGWERALGKPDYVVNRIEPGAYKSVVKRAVNESGELVFLKSHSSFFEGVVRPSNKIEGKFSELFAGITIFKKIKREGIPTETKKISITKDVGIDLFEYLKAKEHLTNEFREKLAIAIIKAYVNQLSNAEIVHTDIKPGNICVKETYSIDDPFIITFIDLEESFQPDSPEKRGHGTIAYLALEFFKSREAFSRRLLKESQDDDSILVDDYHSYFSTASDLFSLGQILVNHLRLAKTSTFYVLGEQLMHDDVNERLALIEKLHHITESTLAIAIPAAIS